MIITGTKPVQKHTFKDYIIFTGTFLIIALILGAIGSNTKDRIINEYLADNYEAIYNDAYSDGYEEGTIEGKNEGYNIGYEDGLIDGFDNGYEEGYSDGFGELDPQSLYAEGYDDGYNDGLAEAWYN